MKAFWRQCYWCDMITKHFVMLNRPNAVCHKCVKSNRLNLVFSKMLSHLNTNLIMLHCIRIVSTRRFVCIATCLDWLRITQVLNMFWLHMLTMQCCREHCPQGHAAILNLCLIFGAYVDTRQFEQRFRRTRMHLVFLLGFGLLIMLQPGMLLV